MAGIKTCALEGCDKLFESKHNSHKYCCINCSRKAKWRQDSAARRERMKEKQQVEYQVKKDLPCLKCGKRMRTTINERICENCTKENQYLQNTHTYGALVGGIEPV